MAREADAEGEAGEAAADDGDVGRGGGGGGWGGHCSVEWGGEGREGGREGRWVMNEWDILGPMGRSGSSDIRHWAGVTPYTFCLVQNEVW